jgi:hypothetical protein
MLGNDEDFMSADVYIDPPADCCNSDQDSVAEDGGGIVEDLLRNVLQVEAYMVVHRGDGDQEIRYEEGASREADDSATAVSDTARKRCSKLKHLPANIRTPFKLSDQRKSQNTGTFRNTRHF